MKIKMGCAMLFFICSSGFSQGNSPPPLTQSQLAYSSVRVAAVQLNGTWIWQGQDDEPQDTVDSVIGYIDRAGADKADLVVFPELLLGKFRVPNRSTQRIGEAASRNGLYVVAGCFEIVDEEGNYKNTALLFDRKGNLVGRFAKIHPAVGEPPFLWPPTQSDPEGCMTPGDALPVFDLDFGRIGIFTCYDGYFPEVPRILSLKGAEVLLWLNARSGMVEDYIVKADAFRNAVHLVCTNKAIGGGTMIAEWPGKIKAVASEGREDYIVADLPLTQLRLHRKHAREFYQRVPDVYSEILGEHPVWRYYDNLPDPPDVPQHCEVEGVFVETPVLPDSSMTVGTPLSPLAVHVKSPWMTGWAELRLPETLSSSMGFHFIDHYKPDCLQLSPLSPWPKWNHDDRSGEWTYQVQTREGLHFAASVRPYRDAVFLEFSIRNETENDLAWVDMNPCLRLGNAPEFHYPFDVSRVFIRCQGKWLPLSETTPTSQEMGKAPWVIIRCKESPVTYEGPREQPNLWLLDQVADVNLMAAETVDGKHLVGYAWDSAPMVLMCNGGYPCLHTGPAPFVSVQKGKTFYRRGCIYFMPNDKDALLQRYEADKAAWKHWPKRHPEEVFP